MDLRSVGRRKTKAKALMILIGVHVKWPVLPSLICVSARESHHLVWGRQGDYGIFPLDSGSEAAC